MFDKEQSDVVDGEKILEEMVEESAEGTLGWEVK